MPRGDGVKVTHIPGSPRRRKRTGLPQYTPKKLLRRLLGEQDGFRWSSNGVEPHVGEKFYQPKVYGATLMRRPGSQNRNK